MSTDFSYNNSTISTTGGFRPNTKNTPLDSRTVINNKADIVSIPMPFIGMEITVLQDETKGNKMTVYKVTALNERNAIDINAGIEEVTVPKNISDLNNDSGFVTSTEMINAINDAKLEGGNTDIDLSAYQLIRDNTLITAAKTIPSSTCVVFKANSSGNVYTCNNVNRGALVAANGMTATAQ